MRIFLTLSLILVLFGADCAVAGQPPAAATIDEVMAKAVDLHPAAFELGYKSYLNFRAKRKPRIYRPSPETWGEWFTGVDKSKYKKILPNFRYFTIVDFTLPSDHKRMFIFDIATGAVERYYVSHGINSGKGRWLLHTSNELVTKYDPKGDVSSHRSAIGVFSVENTFDSVNTGLSLALNGGWKSNRNTRERDVYIHGSDGIHPQSKYALENGAPKTSKGCFMVERRHLNRIISLVQGGSSLYVYWNPEVARSRMADPRFAKAK